MLEFATMWNNRIQVDECQINMITRTKGTPDKI